MQVCKSLGVFILKWQKAALACKLANVAELVCALALWSIMCIKEVDSEKEPKGRVQRRAEPCQRIVICGRLMQPGNMREISSPRACLLHRLFKLLLFDPKRLFEWDSHYPNTLALLKVRKYQFWASSCTGDEGQWGWHNGKKNHNVKRREAKQLAQRKTF